LTVPARQTLCLTDDLTIYRALDHKEALLDALSTGDELLLDLAQVEAIDSAGVQLLLLLDQEARRAGKALRLVAPSPAVADAIALCNLSGRFAFGEAPPAAAEVAAGTLRRSQHG
jgi:anti-anti-sigma factor